MSRNRPQLSKLKLSSIGNGVAARQMAEKSEESGTGSRGRGTGTDAFRAIMALYAYRTHVGFENTCAFTISLASCKTR